MGFTNNITVCIRLCFFSVEPPNKQIKAIGFSQQKQNGSTWLEKKLREKKHKMKMYTSY